MATMTTPVALRAQSSSSESSGVPGWLYLLFFLSGMTGLMYEVVWVRMLTRIVGSTVYATSTVLAAFMAGLAVGSWLIGRNVHRARRPLLWYAVLELGIGLSAVLSLAMPDHMVPLYQAIYQAAGESRAWLTAGQAGLSLLVLLIPTALMGATLPLLCAYGAGYREGFAQYVGTLYARNTLGAVLGVLASGFVLIGAVGESATILIGVAFNIVVAAAALMAARGSGPQPDAPWAERIPRPAVRGAPVSPYSNRVRRAVLVCFALSGFVALASEVVWSRMLILHQGTSIYAFSSMLAVMLAGMALGSSFGARRIDSWRDPLLQLARLQLLIALAIGCALHLFELPWFDAWPAAARLSPVVLIGPLGFLLGVVFPVAARCYTRARGMVGQSIADLYAWNTLGCIAGAVSGGFVLIPLLGAGRSGTSLAFVSVIVALVLLTVHPRGILRHSRMPEWILVAMSCVLLVAVGDPYYGVIERRMHDLYPDQEVAFRHIEEAAGTTTAFGVVGPDPRQQHLWVNGRGMTRKVTATKLMAHLPIWLADNPRDVLVICLGMGTTVRSASRHPDINIQAVELVPSVIDCFDFYYAEAPALLQKPNIRATADDGRNYLLMHDQQYDVITIDPAPPLESAGTVNLYSSNFFRLCRSRLRPGGITSLWVPAASGSEVKMIVRTFCDVFEHVDVWSAPASDGPSPGMLLLGSLQPLQRAPARIRQAYQNRAVVADLLEWGSGLDRPEKLLKLRVGDKSQFGDFLAGVALITDDHPYTEFPLYRALFRAADYNQEGSADQLRAYLNVFSKVTKR